MPKTPPPSGKIMPTNQTKYRLWSIISYSVALLIISYVVGTATYVYLKYVEFEKVFEDELIVYSSTLSPDGKLTVVTYEVRCGVPCNFNTQVSIAPANRPFTPEKDPSFLWIHGQYDLTVRWVGDSAIEVLGVPQDVTIYRRDASVGDVTVEYR
jgi:hypothetical protein